MLNYRYFTRKLLDVKGIIIIVRRAGTHPGIFHFKAVLHGPSVHP
jgi:hypothetical protein